MEYGLKEIRCAQFVRTEFNFSMAALHWLISDKNQYWWWWIIRTHIYVYLSAFPPTLVRVMEVSMRYGKVCGQTAIFMKFIFSEIFLLEWIFLAL